MAPTHRCFCTVYKCGDAIDAAGNIGVLIDARRYRTHQQDEKAAELRRLATETQQAIFREHEISLATAMKDLSVTDNAAVPGIAKALPEHERYRIDKIRKMVSHVSDIKDKIASLRIEVQSIGPAPTRVGDHIITETLGDISALRSTAIDLDRKLSSISRRAKSSSVVSLRDEAVADFKEFYEFIGGIELSWEALLTSRRAQRESELKDGAAEYDSGKNARRSSNQGIY